MANQQELLIKKSDDWLFFDWAEFFSYRDVLYALVKRDFLSKYKRTLLGPIWFILQPIINSCVFTLVFHRFANISTQGVPPELFYFCALLPWGYFSNSAETISNCLIVNAYLFEKIYFPRLIIPISVLISQGITFLLQLGVFLVLYLALSPPETIHFMTLVTGFLSIAGYLVLSAATSLGVGLWIACLTVRYRDLQYVRDFLFKIWLFLTPIVYPSAIIQSEWRWVIALNPMTVVVDGFRSSFFGTGMPSASTHVNAILFCGIVFASGLIIFNRIQRNFVDDI